MRFVSRLLNIMALVIVVSIVSVHACTVTLWPLRTQFRKAESVFVATVTDITDAPGNHEENKKKRIFGKVTFDLEKGWKGVDRGQTSLLSDVGSSDGCLTKFDYFKKGEKYLIFASKGYVSFESATKFSNGRNTIKRLDDFWFRTWATVYPF